MKNTTRNKVEEIVKSEKLSFIEKFSEIEKNVSECKIKTWASDCAQNAKTLYEMCCNTEEYAAISHAEDALRSSKFKSNNVLADSFGVVYNTIEALTWLAAGNKETPKRQNFKRFQERMLFNKLLKAL